MKGIQISLKWMLCLVAVQQMATVSAVYTMNQTCAQYATGFIADPSSCERYGFCENGQLQGTAQCPDDLLYNSKLGVCEEPGPDVCTVANVASICKYAREGSYIADPNDCNRYCQCLNKVAVCASCPQGQVFDKDHVRCVWAEQASTKCVAESICRLVPDGKFLGDPVNCGLYVGCSGSVDTPGQCPKNTYFNKGIGMCQYNNPCENPTPAGVGLGVLAPLPSNPDACKTLKGPFPAFVQDDQTCFGYYVCTSAAGPGTWDKCPEDFHFNNGDCVTPFTFPCTKDRCGNINQLFVGAVESDCHNFLICKNQTSQGEASGYQNYAGLPCSNNQYFDEFTQTCDTKKPSSSTYKLCL